MRIVTNQDIYNALHVGMSLEEIRQYMPMGVDHEAFLGILEDYQTWGAINIEAIKERPEPIEPVRLPEDLFIL